MLGSDVKFYINLTFMRISCDAFLSTTPNKVFVLVILCGIILYLVSYFGIVCCKLIILYTLVQPDSHCLQRQHISNLALLNDLTHNEMKQ